MAAKHHKSSGMTAHQRRFATCARKTKGVSSQTQRKKILKDCLAK